ncbi:MAG: outer membrane protein assembly factor BamA [Bordetella sp.]|nr:MAG: outer membrane protein assembly factor BamA [Bordetella sp.]
MCSWYRLSYRNLFLINVIIFTLFKTALASELNPFVIRDIKIQGIKRVERETVFTYLPIKIGNTFSNIESKNVIHKLYETGFFKNIEIKIQNDVVWIFLEENPVIFSVNFNKIKAFDLQTIINVSNNLGFNEGKIFNDSILKQVETAIKEQYLRKGYYNSNVVSTTNRISNNRISVDFNILEGPLAKINQIKIFGNNNFTEKQLLSLFKLKKSNLFNNYMNSNEYSIEKLTIDIESLRSFYLEQGYLEFSVKYKTILSPHCKKIDIEITIHEGNIYKIRKIDINVDLFNLNINKINKLLLIKEGEIFNSMQIQSSINYIKDYLNQLGYAFANVNFNQTLDRSKYETDVVFNIDCGYQIYINKINITGNFRTRDTVIRRELQQQESSVYNSKAIERSYERIARLGFFDEIKFNTQLISDTINHVDLNIKVKEKPTGIINLGIGYGSSEKMTFSTGISEDNIFGRGSNLTLNLNTSRSNRILAFAYTDPILLKKELV